LVPPHGAGTKISAQRPTSLTVNIAVQGIQQHGWGSGEGQHGNQRHNSESDENLFHFLFF